MNTDEVDEVVKLMDLRFRTVYSGGKEFIYATREEAQSMKLEFSRKGKEVKSNYE